MLNITKLKIWPELSKLGFEPINYNSHGKKVAIGASLRKKLVSTSGEEFYTDIIGIEPKSYFKASKKYYIYGVIKTPYYDEYFRYDEIGRKEKTMLEVRRINDFFTAKDILPTVEKMLK